jgi:hypothetical protein
VATGRFPAMRASVGPPTDLTDKRALRGIARGLGRKGVWGAPADRRGFQPALAPNNFLERSPFEAICEITRAKSMYCENPLSSSPRCPTRFSTDLLRQCLALGHFHHSDKDVHKLKLSAETAAWVINGLELSNTIAPLKARTVPTGRCFECGTALTASRCQPLLNGPMSHVPTRPCALNIEKIKAGACLALPWGGRF